MLLLVIQPSRVLTVTIRHIRHVLHRQNTKSRLVTLHSETQALAVTFIHLEQGIMLCSTVIRFLTFLSNQRYVSCMPRVSISQHLVYYFVKRLHVHSLEAGMLDTDGSSSSFFPFSILAIRFRARAKMRNNFSISYTYDTP